MPKKILSKIRISIKPKEDPFVVLRQKVLILLGEKRGLEDNLKEVNEKIKEIKNNLKALVEEL